jgi:hypothetical protein
MQTALRDPNFVMAAMLTVVLANVTPATAQTEPASNDCLSISVNTKDAPQLREAISVCTQRPSPPSDRYAIGCDEG